MSIKTFNYKKIQELRKLAIEEISAVYPIMTVDHLKLAEMMVQTAIMAGLDDGDVDKEKTTWQKKSL